MVLIDRVKLDMLSNSVGSQHSFTIHSYIPSFGNTADPGMFAVVNIAYVFYEREFELKLNFM